MSDAAGLRRRSTCGKTVATLSRAITHCYNDPLDAIWIRAAERVGIRVVRSNEVFASYDGAGTLTIANDEDFDADDSVAQLVLHELCHALVAGPRALDQVDWGLDQDGAPTSEHATHRLQAALTSRYGLRALFGVTTEHRSYWDALPADPLAPGRDPAIELARAAMRRAEQSPWCEALGEALEATARIADIVRPHVPPESLFARTRALHRSGFVRAEDSSRRCGDCAWIYASGVVSRCRQSKRAHGGRGSVVRPDDVACERWEPALDAGSCARCGACCRQGFDLVQVGPREPFARAHPALVADGLAGLHVPRPGGRCVALEGNGALESPYRCRHYATRPRACREFPVGGDACLEARTRARSAAERGTP